MPELIDYPALNMHQLFSSAVAQSTAGPSPLIGPVVRLLITSMMVVELHANKNISHKMLFKG